MKSDLKIVLESLENNDFQYSDDPAIQDWLHIETQKQSRIDAAVAICFAGKNLNEAKIILTLRRDNLQTHAGQVAFPGGVVETQDEGDCVRTALRELEEEVGISSKSAQFLFQMPIFPTVTGSFKIKPCVFYYSEEMVLNPQWAEVAEAEWVSLGKMIQTATVEIRPPGQTKHPVFYWDDKKIWGVTAWILSALLKPLIK